MFARSRSCVVALACVVVPLTTGTASAGVIFSLSFENSLTGAGGELPTQASGVGFRPGLVGLAGDFPAGSILRYESAGNMNHSAGTLEFLLTPDWNGNDGVSHFFLTWGGAGGMTFLKDSANNLRGIFRRFGVGGPEAQAFATPLNVSGWRAGETHHLVYTWDDSVRQLNFFLDGRLVRANTHVGTLPPIGATTFQIGGDNGPGNLNGALDELRIHDRALTPPEVAARYAELTAVPEPASVSLVAAVAVFSVGWVAVRRGRSVATGGRPVPDHHPHVPLAGV